MKHQKTNLLYSGKAKDIYSTNDEKVLIQHFKDNMTAGNGARNEIITNKGIVNAAISEYFMTLLKKYNINNHFIGHINSNEQAILKVRIIPLEVIVRNVAAGSFCKRFGVKNGTVFTKPCVEFSYKDDNLGDPAISEGQIVAMEIANEPEIEYIKQQALLINEILIKEFQKINLNLIDFKIEFGLVDKNNIILADEISPDSCRLWDANGKSFDKDVFRNNQGNVMDGYNYILNKLIKD